MAVGNQAEKPRFFIDLLNFNEEKIQKYYEQEQDIVYNSNIEKANFGILQT